MNRSQLEISVTGLSNVYLGKTDIVRGSVNVVGISNTFDEIENFTDSDYVIDYNNGLISLTREPKAPFVVVWFDDTMKLPEMPKPADYSADADQLDDSGKRDNALSSLRNFVNAQSPTNAQVVATVKLLCRVLIALCKRYGI